MESWFPQLHLRKINYHRIPLILIKIHIGLQQATQGNITYYIPYQIKLKGYTIQTSNHPPYASHPAEWYFEASKDNINYHHIHHFIDFTSKMNNNLACKHIDVKPSGFISFLELEQSDRTAKIHQIDLI